MKIGVPDIILRGEGVAANDVIAIAAKQQDPVEIVTCLSK